MRRADAVPSDAAAADEPVVHSIARQVPALGSAAGGDATGDDLAAAARALFSLGRLFARQPIRDLLDARPGQAGRAVDLSRVLVVQAVEDGPATSAGATSAGATSRGAASGSSAPSRDVSDAEVTVGAVAERLGIDPSTASRLVAEAVRDGYLARSASPTDGRRACLVLTEAGQALAQASRRFQREVFADATASWTERERGEFARLFITFADTIAARHAEVVGRLARPPEGA